MAGHNRNSPKQRTFRHLLICNSCVPYNNRHIYSASYIAMAWNSLRGPHSVALPPFLLEQAHMQLLSSHVLFPAPLWKIQAPRRAMYATCRATGAMLDRYILCLVFMSQITLDVADGQFSWQKQAHQVYSGLMKKERTCMRYLQCPRCEY